MDSHSLPPSSIISLSPTSTFGSGVLNHEELNLPIFLKRSISSGAGLVRLVPQGRRSENIRSITAC